MVQHAGHGDAADGESRSRHLYQGAGQQTHESYCKVRQYRNHKPAGSGFPAVSAGLLLLCDIVDNVICSLRVVESVAVPAAVVVVPRGLLCGFWEHPEQPVVSETVVWPCC